VSKESQRYGEATLRISCTLCLERSRSFHSWRTLTVRSSLLERRTSLYNIFHTKWNNIPFSYKNMFHFIAISHSFIAKTLNYIGS